MVSIRPAEARDLPHLPEIETAAAALFAPFGLDFAPGPDRVDEIRPYVDAGRVWVAEVDGGVVGFAMAGVIGGGAHLEEVGVLPEYGRRGIGSALIESVCEWAKDQGFDTITLSTQKNVPWNMPYYEKLGFVALPEDALPPAYQKLRQHERELGLPVEDRVIMRKTL